MREYAAGRNSSCTRTLMPTLAQCSITGSSRASSCMVTANTTSSMTCSCRMSSTALSGKTSYSPIFLIGAILPELGIDEADQSQADAAALFDQAATSRARDPQPTIRQ